MLRFISHEKTWYRWTTSTRTKSIMFDNEVWSAKHRSFMWELPLLWYHIKSYQDTPIHWNKPPRILVWPPQHNHNARQAYKNLNTNLLLSWKFLPTCHSWPKARHVRIQIIITWATIAQSDQNAGNRKVGLKVRAFVQVQLHTVNLSTTLQTARGELGVASGLRDVGSIVETVWYGRIVLF